MARRNGGRETWYRLLNWDKAQSDSERLAARLLRVEGYKGIDPSHPLGGRDKGQDIRCSHEDREWIVAVYFPRGQKNFSEIKRKYTDDLKKANDNKVSGFIFFTNQELSLAERDELKAVSRPLLSDIYHLERIASALDTPKGYGLRLEFLSIEMTKEEQIGFFNEREQVLYEILDTIKATEKKRKHNSGIATVYVDIHQEDLFSSSISIFGSKLMACKNCGEVFRAERPPLSYVFQGGLETVTCPACGKVQAYQ
jgi:hypothetical protein